MKRIEGFTQYCELLKANKTAHDPIIYNVMLLPHEVQGLIVDKKLFYHELERGLAVYRGEKDFYKLYLFIEASGDFELSSLDKPIVLELIYLERRPDHKVQKLEAKCEAIGFIPYVTNLRRSLRLDVALLSEPYERLDRIGLQLVSPSLQQLEQLIILWEKNLDRYDSIIPDTVELQQMITQGEIFCLQEGNCICGAVKLKKENNKTGSIWLVVIEPSQRGKGIAGLLIEAALWKAAEAGLTNCFIWTDEKNHSMERVLEKMDFRLDNIRSEEYILK